MYHECIIIVVPVYSAEHQVPPLIRIWKGVELYDALLAATLVLRRHVKALPTYLDLIVLREVVFVSQARRV